MKEIDVLINCPVCGRKYREENARVVQMKRSAMLVHTSCGFCSSASLAVVARGQEAEGMVTMGMLTDLDYGEACQFLRNQPVSADEVLELYEKGRKSN